jgi:WD40 repeat protein
LVARTIQELFAGNVAAFLQGETAIFDDVRAVLDSQFERLLPLERELIFWLAVEREPTSVEVLFRNLALPASRSRVLEALASLKRRCLVEQGGTGLGLQNVVLEYATDCLIEGICQEFATSDLQLLHTHALMKAQAKEYVRASQQRLLLEPVAGWLAAHWGGKAGVGKRLRVLLAGLHAKPGVTAGYAPATILHLLLHLGSDVRGLDFSDLPVWQADLRAVDLPEVNLNGCDLSGSLFTEPLGAVRAIVYDPAGKRIMAGTTDGNIWAWQTATQQVEYIANGHAGAIAKMTLSADGTLVASVAWSGEVLLWDAATGQRRLTLARHSRPVEAVALRPDGSLLASNLGNQIHLWQLPKGRLHATLSDHAAEVHGLAFTPDGATLVSGDRGGRIRLWDVALTRCRAVLGGEIEMVRAFAIHPAGTQVAALLGPAATSTLAIWDLQTGKLLMQTETADGIFYDLAYSPDGTILAGAGHDALVYLWEADTGRRLRLLQGHRHMASAVAFSPDGQTLASGSSDHRLCLWEVETGRLLHTLPGYRREVTWLSLDPQGRWLVTGGGDEMLRLWDLQTRQVIRAVHAHTRRLVECAFSPDGQLVATIGSDRAVRLWEMPAGRCLHTMWGHSQAVQSVAFHPGGHLLATAGLDDTVRLWDVESGAELALLAAHASYVNHVIFSPEGRLLVSSGADQMVLCWEISDLTAPVVLHRRHFPASPWGTGISSCFHPAGQTLACFTHDTLFLLDMTTFEVQQTLEGHHNWPLQVLFSPDGALLMTVGQDGTIRIWRTTDLALLHTLTVPDGYANNIAFSQEGHIFSSNKGGTISRWDAYSGAHLHTWRVPAPYAGMNITGSTGLTEAQKAALRLLGARDDEPGAPHIGL